MRGFSMPAFTFEKLSPPATPAPEPVSDLKPRGKMGQLLDRLVGRNAARSSSAHRSSSGRKPTESG
jgi:hypothetical protein